jgi:prophage tail gpP-like protein
MEELNVGGRNFFMVNRPPFLTRAVIVVAGQIYYEWVTVQVRLSINEQPPYKFTFTNSEQEPYGPNSAFRIRPPDDCMIFMDGIKVIDGFVTERQVYYDATQHTVQIQGVGKPGKLSNAPAASKTGEFKNIDIMGLAKALAGKAGVNVSGEGAAGGKFDRAMVQPGESAWEMIEKFARSAGKYMTENANGDLVLTDGSMGGRGASLVEGYNIVSGRERIYTMMQSQGQQVAGQGPGSDTASMGEVAQRFIEQVTQSVAGGGGGGAKENTLSRSLSEIPAFAMDLLKKRAQHEDSISDNLMIYVTIVVVGWRNEGGGLWLPGDYVHVDSPMLIMNRTLRIKAVTFSQDDHGGTRSTIELVNKLGQGQQQADGGDGGGGGGGGGGGEGG